MSRHGLTWVRRSGFGRARSSLISMLWKCYFGWSVGWVSAADSPPMAEEAAEVLRRAMETQTQWVKVHAAESLLSVGMPEGVREEFERELQQSESVSQYRIGIWRVLAKCADDAATAGEFIGKIQAAMCDRQGTDVGHAAETLGKLAASFPDELRDDANHVAGAAEGQLHLLSVWAMAADRSEPQRGTYRSRLIQYLADKDANLRGLGAYALRFLGTLSQPDWRELARAAEDEPSDSEASTSLNSAAVCTAPLGVDADRLTKINMRLRLASRSTRGPDRYEMCEALSLRGETTDLPMLNDLMMGRDPLRDLADLPTPATDAAIHDHPANVDVRIAAAKAVLQVLRRDQQRERAEHGAPIMVSANDWPWWRGYQRNGIAPDGQSPPRAWSSDTNVVWSAPIPGRGHGSPTVVGEHVLITAADDHDESQSVLCFDRSTGRSLWKTDVHRGKQGLPGNKRSTHASSTVACDGEHVFVAFQNDNAIYVTALDRRGEKVWQRKASDYVVYQGFGASPAIHASLVIISADHQKGGTVVAMDRRTGEIVWSQRRPARPNYTSPILLEAAGCTQLLLTGCDCVASFDPLTGRILWETDGSTTECVTSTVTDGTHIFSTGGYPRNHVAAIRADGSAFVAWNEEIRVYVPSLIAHAGHVYAVTDAGVAMCWDSSTGKRAWRGRLGGSFSSSPILANDTIYVTSEQGTTYLFRASPDRFELLGKNQLGDECYATPVLCRNHLFARVASSEGGTRAERLYCVGAKE